MTDTKTKPAPKLPGRKTDAVVIRPHQCVVAGIDYECDETDPLYDERVHLPLDSGLLNSIVAHGVLMPISGQLVDFDGKPAWAIVSGRRRVLHAREAERLTGKPVNIRLVPHKGSKKATAAAVIVENEQRQDDDMLTRARKAERFMRVHKATKAQVGEVFGITPQMVGELLNLLKVEPEIRERLEELNAAPTTIARLGRLTAELQEEVASELEADAAAGKKVTQASATKKVRAKTSPKKSDEPRPRSKEDLKVAADFLESVNPQSDALSVLLWALGDDLANPELTELFERAPGSES